MSGHESRHLYLPARDRSFWKAEAASGAPLLYLAWGTRDFHRQPIPASRHEGWVGVLIEEGSPLMVVRRQAIRMPPGTIAIIGPDCPFGWRGASGPTRFRLWMWRTLAPAAHTPNLRATFATRRLARQERRPFVMLHDLCRREVLRRSGPEPTYLEGCRLLFEATVQREILDRRDDAGDEANLVALARAWVDAHLDSREPIARLCDYLNVSQSTLYRVFAAGEGVSPLSYFQQARMRRARELMAGGSLSVKEVAHALGYGHANDLSRAYKRHFGVSPTRTGMLAR